MADVYDFRKSAEKLGRKPEAPAVRECPEAEEAALEPPGVFSRVDSTGLGAVHELKDVTVIESLEPPDLEIE
jgi:hypothetical protein